MKTKVQELSRMQAQILDAIKEAVAATGFPPTIRELGIKVELASPSSVAYQLRELERKGHIQRLTASPRAIRVIGGES